ncbi:MAG TPA: aldo/keto reductase [Bacteroidetes bacterium]|nr:aldo/keto reductase [Bacteroidota bacterium]
MNPFTHKLALGTVQFGLDYGISNARGQVPTHEVKQILRLAAKAGVQTLDTAYAYGNSEKVLGTCLPDVPDGNFKLISKFPPGHNLPPIAEILGKSLDRLGQKSLYAYLFHSLETYQQQPQSWEMMQALKAEGKIQKIGFSLYAPKDALALLESGKKAGLSLDLIQVPFSILDQRWAEVFPRLKTAGVEIHVRSAFLQGLVFRDPSALDAHFALAQPALKHLNTLSQELNLPVSALCLGFALRQPEIDQVVIGVANPAQFQENLEMVARIAEIEPIMQELKTLAITDEQILLPMNWPK